MNGRVGPQRARTSEVLVCVASSAFGHGMGIWGACQGLSPAVSIASAFGWKAKKGAAHQPPPKCV